MQKINKIILKSLTLFVAAAVITSCGGGEESTIDSIIAGGDLSAIQAKKKELSDQQKSITSDIAKLDSFIIASRNEDNFPLITVQKLAEQDFVHFIELQGDVTTRQNVLIYPEMAGTLVKIHVQEGQSVKSGQLLATIDDGGMASQLAQMKTQLALAETTYERQKRLWDQKIGSEIQFLQAQTNYEAQQL